MASFCLKSKERRWCSTTTGNLLLSDFLDIIYLDKIYKFMLRHENRVGKEAKETLQDVYSIAEFELNRAGKNLSLDSRFGDPFQHIDEIAKSVEDVVQLLSEKLTGEERARVLDLIFEYGESVSSVENLKRIRYQFGDESIKRERVDRGFDSLDILTRKIKAFKNKDELPPLSEDERKKRIRRLEGRLREAIMNFQKDRNFEGLNSINEAIKEAAKDEVTGEKTQQVIHDYLEDPRFSKELAERIKNDPQLLSTKEFWEVNDFFQDVRKKYSRISNNLLKLKKVGDLFEKESILRLPELRF